MPAKALSAARQLRRREKRRIENQWRRNGIISWRRRQWRKKAWL